MTKLTHFTDDGAAHMVDVSQKADSSRVAVASGRITMNPTTVNLIRSGSASKGDVLGVAQIAGIMAAKNTPQIIPLCHPLMLSGVEVSFEIDDNGVSVAASVRTVGKTGVEMEALTACSAALLTIYDMMKAVDRGMTIERIRVESKDGGASGSWQREPADDESSAFSCADGVCAVVPTADAQQIDLQALGSIRMPIIPTENEEPNPEH